MSRPNRSFQPQMNPLEAKISCSDVWVDMTLIPIPLAGPMLTASQEANNGYTIYLLYFADQTPQAPAPIPPLPGGTPMSPYPLP